MNWNISSNDKINHILTFFGSYQEAADKQGYYILPEDVFETTEQAFATVDALYTTGTPTFYGQTTTKSGPVAAIGGYLSGYFDNESKNEVTLAGFCQQLTFDGNNIASTIDNIWSSAYSSIEQANMIINKLSVSTKINDDNKRVLTAEAKFFRAFNYFFLVRYFGEIPLVNEAKTWQESSKSSIADIYHFIINDLNTAIEHLSIQSSRISPLIAKTLLCDVYLTASGYPLQANYYQQSAMLARDIIENGAANDSICGVSAYKTLYNQNCSELIYSYVPSENTFSALSFSKSAALSKEQFIEEVWKERLSEFPLEMKLWNDIQRTRKYPIPLQGGKITFVDIVGAMNPWNAVYGLESLLLPVSENITGKLRKSNQLLHAEDYVLFKLNLGEHLSMDETCLSQCELYTIATNKAAKGGKGALVAMIKGTKSEEVVHYLSKLPRSLRHYRELF